MKSRRGKSYLVLSYDYSSPTASPTKEKGCGRMSASLRVVSHSGLLRFAPLRRHCMGSRRLETMRGHHTAHVPSPPPPRYAGWWTSALLPHLHWARWRHLIPPSTSSRFCEPSVPPTTASTSDSPAVSMHQCTGHYSATACILGSHSTYLEMSRNFSMVMKNNEERDLTLRIMLPAGTSRSVRSDINFVH
ncbi:hypothetical protein SCHPADRAFT_472383 [Schizopora paradoxa]|uniref:Uncharacterized protein n=1 Tax=Schizopora paradoxa TaxID=27342 RepID=A0A0H2RHQ7_9AGAM|nr:hypothetical protein SCHPADRAFT_472383 [Schizopora paradoxa]